jgi:DNA-binding MarR family transcriptional regulator
MAFYSDDESGTGTASRSGQLDDQELQVWRGLLRSHARLTNALSGQLQSEAGVSLQEYQLLQHLFDHPIQRMPMSELARLVLLTPSGITRMVDRLVGRNLVNRQPVRSDARVQHAVLTDAGRELVISAVDTYANSVRRLFLDKLGPDDAVALSKVWNSLDIGDEG